MPSNIVFLRLFAFRETINLEPKTKPYKNRFSPKLKRLYVYVITFLVVEGSLFSIFTCLSALFSVYMDFKILHRIDTFLYNESEYNLILFAYISVAIHFHALF